MCLLFFRKDCCFFLVMAWEDLGFMLFFAKKESRVPFLVF